MTGLGISRIVSVVACMLLWVLPTQAGGEVLKVAFLPEMYGFYTMEENGGFSGYNHDYLMNVAQYTNWEYEYVIIQEGSIAASLEKAMTMLEAGEIDLLGSVFGSNQELERFEVGERNYGVARYNLYSLRNNYQFAKDNYFLQDEIRIALVEGYEELNEVLYTLVEGRQLNYQYHYVSNYRESFDMLMRGEVDNIISLNVSKDSQYLTELTSVERIPFYFISTKGNQALIAELDEAISNVEIASPTIQQKLFETYFGMKYEDEFLFRQEELDLLEEITQFRVGLLRQLPPYQYHSEDGKAMGITLDIFLEIQEILGIDFEFVWFDSWQEMNLAIEQAEIDIIGTLPQDYELMESLPVILTDPVLSSGVYWLSREEEVANPDIYYYMVSSNIPFFLDEELHLAGEVVPYMEQMAAEGNVSLFCDPYVAEYYIDALKLENIKVNTVSDVRSDISMGVGKHLGVVMVGMLNRSFLFLDNYELDKIIYENTQAEVHYSLSDFMREYALEINLAIFFLALLVIGFILRHAFMLRDLSRRDGLTKLYNSGYFHEYSGKYRSHHHKGALILVDIDYFKGVNDNYGHQLGDEIIKQVAKGLETQFSSLGTVGRLGGDEFAVLIHKEVAKEQLEQRARALLASLKENGTGVPVTLSIGGFLVESTCDYRTLYKRADEALYKVKENGRNNCYFCKQVDTSTMLDPESKVLNYVTFQEKTVDLLSISSPQQKHALLRIHPVNLAEIPQEKRGSFYGHLGERLKNQVRSRDFLGKKEDFYVFLDTCGTEEQVSDCKKRILQALSAVYSLDGVAYSLEFAMETALYPQDGNLYQELEENLK